MTQSKTKNDTAWEELFKTYDILKHIADEGEFIISADQIRKVREPRLMAKCDNKKNLPSIFRANFLTILPISRNKYLISQSCTYAKLENRDSHITTGYSLPNYIQSIDPQNIQSESVAINCAFASGILDNFLDDSNLIETLNGRMGSKEFDYYIRTPGEGKTHHIHVNKSQIEVDGAFEGIKYLSIIEAKLVVADDFLVRQLYYPYRLFSSKVDKKVKSVFLVYSNGIYDLYEYEFPKLECYNSLNLVKHKRYSFENIDITSDDLQNLINNTTVELTEPQIPFPQADSFDRLINLCESLKIQDLTLEDITINNAFDIRQARYYADAGRYLGLIMEQKSSYTLTNEGRDILQLSYNQRQLRFASCILKHRAFMETYKISMTDGHIPDKLIIVGIMKNSSLYNIHTDSTFERRAQTIISWVNWILRLITV